MSNVTLNFDKLDGYGIAVADLLNGILKKDEDHVLATLKRLESIALDHQKHKVPSVKLKDKQEVTLA